jgi:hypothetical protein
VCQHCPGASIAFWNETGWPRVTDPMRPFVLSTLLALAFLAVLVPGSAGATVGGPLVVEIVGYAPIDRKIYYLEHHVDSDDDALPQLWFIRTDGPSVGKHVPVRSWYRQDTEHPDGSSSETFDKRLERLRAHVVPMGDATERWSLTTTVLDSRTWDGTSIGYGERPEHSVLCELVHEDRRSIADTLTVTVYETPTVAIHSAFETPSGGAGVVVLRYLGDPIETGYGVDSVAFTHTR